MVASSTSFLRDFGLWAQKEEGVSAAALIGSHARNEARQDSDIDLILLVDSPQDYLSDTYWLHRFGEPFKQQVEDYGRVTSLRVWFADGREVEFGFSTPDWAAAPLDEGARQVIQGEMRVLYEKEGLLSRWLTEVGTD